MISPVISISVDNKMVAIKQTQFETTSQRRLRSSTVLITPFNARVQDLIPQRETLSNESNSFERKHRIYLSKLDELKKLKKEHRNEFSIIPKKVNNLNKLIKSHQSPKTISSDEKTIITIDKNELSGTRRESDKNRKLLWSVEFVYKKLMKIWLNNVQSILREV